MLISKTARPWCTLPVGAMFVREGVEPVRENVYRKVSTTEAKRVWLAGRKFTFLIATTPVKEVR